MEVYAKIGKILTYYLMTANFNTYWIHVKDQIQWAQTAITTA